jgi:hypothetical protein
MMAQDRHIYPAYTVNEPAQNPFHVCVRDGHVYATVWLDGSLWELELCIHIDKVKEYTDLLCKLSQVKTWQMVESAATVERGHPQWPKILAIVAKKFRHNGYTDPHNGSKFSP